MRTVFKIFLMVLSILIIWSTYIFFTFPNKEKIEKSLKDKYSQNVTPDKTNYDSLVKIDKKRKKNNFIR